MIVKESMVPTPSRSEKRVLRAMIWLGLAAMCFFLFTLLQASSRGHGVLYAMLLSTLIYSCLKVLHEWYHYYAISAPSPGAGDERRTVDIFTTFCAGEPYGMLEQTLAAAQRIRYPHVTWCCDEANDERVKEICARYGARHVARTEKKDAKAGNINHALQFASGELMVVLDPDHVPAPGFLDAVVPYFEKEEVGFVQVVQAYYNHTESLVAKGAAQQTYQFYGPMMMSMHAYGTVQAIGANCTFRRAAINSIGGHAAGLAEDMNTAMHLHAKGWKSVYVPAVLTRGLVPATLSAYYKQQLKWARGTFELLVTSYPALFRRFSWRQKLHYFALPFHYLCGLIFLINFLVPVISLFTGEIPLSMDIGSFMLAAFPLVWMTILVRHYVQKWVAEETERGFHVVGGLLQIGTWWVHLLGMTYTFIRKKVPYIPTPKSDTGPTPLSLHLPNIFIAALSAAAIAYGLWYDLNPYTLFMAGLACINIFFMLFVIRIARNAPGKLAALPAGRRIKAGFWLFRHWVYAQLRRFALLLSFLVIALSVGGYAYLNAGEEATDIEEERPAGIYYGLGPFDRINGNDLQTGNNATKGHAPVMVALNVPFDTAGAFPWRDMEELHAMGIVPVVYWKWPGTGSFLDDMLNGSYDRGLTALATQLAARKMPVLLRPVMDDPGGTPVPDTEEMTRYEELRTVAWRYVHDLFFREKVFEVAWVRDVPTDPEAESCFPGKQYVDWLNFPVGRRMKNDTIQSLESVYRPFHDAGLLRPGYPVMLSDLPVSATNKVNWWEQGMAVLDTTFREIKGVIESPVQWKVRYEAGALSLNGHTSAERMLLPPTRVEGEKPEHRPMQLPVTMKGVSYDKGFHWFRNRHGLTRKELAADLAAMKELGINTVMRSMPGFYDGALLQGLRNSGMKLVPRAPDVMEPLDVTDPAVLRRRKERILDMVRRLRNEPSVIAWNLGQDMLAALGNSFPPPTLYYYRSLYLDWLQEVCAEIRHMDSLHPVGIDVRWDKKGRYNAAILKERVPSLNGYFLVADSSLRNCDVSSLPAGSVWGSLPASRWKEELSFEDRAVFLPEWQDMEMPGYLSLDGIMDLEGRRKTGFDIVEEKWRGKMEAVTTVPRFRVLKPARAVAQDYVLTYHMLIPAHNGGWQFYNESIPGLEFEWYLVRTDRYGTFRYMKYAGKGKRLDLLVPRDPFNYRLYVKAVRNGRVRDEVETLNIPLY